MAFLVKPHLRRVSVLAVPLGTALIIMSAGSMWHPTAQSSRAADPPPPSRTAGSTGDRVAQEPRDRGATYEWLESQATRVTVRFPDVVAISERTADADLKTRLTDLVGNDLATFRVHRVDAMNDVLEFRSTDVAEIRPTRRSSSRATLDWAGRQAYSLWKDRAAGASQFEWQDGLLRPRGARVHDLDRDVSELRTEWANGLSATASRAATRRHVMTGAPGARRLFRQPAQKGQRGRGVQPLVRRRTGAGLVLPGSDRGLPGRRPTEHDRRVAVYPRSGMGKRPEFRVPLLPYARRHTGFRGTAAERMERKSPRAGDAHHPGERTGL